MKNLLHIISSPMQDYSHSIKLGNAIIRQLSVKHPESKITERNLIADDLPYLTDLQIAAFFKDPADLTDVEKVQLSYSDVVLKEIEQADIIVIGAPMYNFGIHAALKAFIDQIVRIGRTIKYQADGSRIGVLADKTVYLAISSGGSYTDSEFNPVEDYIVNYLRAIFKYIGINQVIPFIIEGTVKPGFTANYDAICSNI